MKIKSAFLLACLFGASLSGCGERQAPPAPAGQATSAATSTKPPPPASESAIASFEDCVAAGNPVAESYPPQCHTRDGRNFTEDVGNRVDKQGLIQVDEPTPNQTITSPLTIHGKARGPWYLEASFPARLVGADGTTLTTVVVQANGDWMTEDFVPFQVTMTFTVPPGMRKGKLIMEKSNASGLPEHDDQLVIPVRF